jgi:hypothetical protein
MNKESLMSDMPQRPWWKEPLVLMIIGGPAAVVIASFVTLSLAIIHPDPPLNTAQVAAEEAADQPAVQVRNHVATGGKH